MNKKTRTNMKFSLISVSPNEGIDEREGRKSITAFPPLSILYLAAVLEREGVEVSVLDQPAMGLTVEATLRWVEKQNPDVLGFSTLSTSGRTAALISREVKKKNPNVTTVFGNHFATFNAERILNKYSSVDIVARGEGEKTVVELARCLNNGGDLKEIRGISFRHEGRIVSTPDQLLTTDLDSLPFPDRKRLNQEYHCVIAGTNVAPKKFTSIVSSRGCVYACRFCSCTEIAKNRWRPRSAKNTLEELQLLANEGYKQLIFVDDSFTMNPKRVREICRGMRKEKLDMEWICEGRVDICSYDMLKEMVNAGCRVLYFGIESANQRILDYYNKRITPQQSETAVKTAKKAGVDVIAGSFILGAPDETPEEMQNTINFARRVPIDLPQFNILGASPGNDIWNEFVAKGFINVEEHWEIGVAVADIYPGALVSSKEIRRAMHNAFFRHVARPAFLVEQVAKTVKSPYRRNVMLSNLSRLNQIRESANTVA